MMAEKAARLEGPSLDLMQPGAIGQPQRASFHRGTSRTRRAMVTQLFSPIQQVRTRHPLCWRVLPLHGLGERHSHPRPTNIMRSAPPSLPTDTCTQDSFHDNTAIAASPTHNEQRIRQRQPRTARWSLRRDHCPSRASCRRGVVGLVDAFGSINDGIRRT